MRFLLPLLAGALLLPAQTITMLRGPVDYQVYQRGEDNKATIAVELEVKDWEGKPIYASIKRGVVPLPGFIAYEIGKVKDGKVSGAVKGVPSGGPYRFELRTSRVGSAASARSNVLVGDIWLLAGQSNMEGVGDLVNTEKPSDRVHSFNQSDEWVNAKEPLHELPSAVDRVHWRKNAKGELERLTGDELAKYRAGRKKGAGLGLPFAIEYERRTGVPVGLLPCAHGGTSMDQWSPDLKDKGGDSLYGATIRRAELVGGRVKGILWYQGESDASPAAAKVFEEKFAALVAAFRKDLKDVDLPFHYVQIGRHISNGNIPAWNAVQESQRTIEKKLGNAVVFSAVDSDLDDGIHVSTLDLLRIGRGMAAVAAGKAKKGPHLEQVVVEPQLIRVRYTEVNGKLVSPGRLSGFSLHNAAGEEQPLIYKMSIDPADPTSVLLHFQGKLPEGLSLSYGQGKNRYCNLRDELNLGAPVFGPYPLAQ